MSESASEFYKRHNTKSKIKDYCDNHHNNDDSKQTAKLQDSLPQNETDNISNIKEHKETRKEAGSRTISLARSALKRSYYDILYDGLKFMGYWGKPISKTRLAMTMINSQRYAKLLIDDIMLSNNLIIPVKRHDYRENTIGYILTSKGRRYIELYESLEKMTSSKI